MSSPTFSDALSFVVDAQAEILSAVADWKSYADVAAEAYSQAYEDQGRVLGSVNKRLEEMRKGSSAIIGSVSHSAESYGPRLIQLGITLLRGRIVPPYNYVRHRVVTPESLAAEEHAAAPKHAVSERLNAVS